MNRSLSIHTYYFVTNLETRHERCTKFVYIRNNLNIVWPLNPDTWLYDVICENTYVSLLFCSPSNGPSEPFRKFLPRWYDQSLGRTPFGENEALWELLMSYYRKLVIKGELNCGTPGCPWLWISPWLITSITIQNFCCSQFQRGL